MVTPYHELPRVRFLVRMATPILFVFILGFFALGLTPPQHATRRPAGMEAKPAPTANLPPFQVAKTHYEVLLNDWKKMPEPCWTGKTVNEVQARQCDEFWKKWLTSAAIGAAPFGSVLLFIYLALDSLGLTYDRARRRIKNRRMLFAGVVTEPAHAPADLYAWVYCMQAVTVQLGNGVQIKVYLPLTAPRPRPGETLAIFDGGRVFGTKRYLAMFYAPHLAIVRGV